MAGRWLIYAATLTLATVVVALVALAATERQSTTTKPPATATTTVEAISVAEEPMPAGSMGDSFTPIEGDTSRYLGPNHRRIGGAAEQRGGRQ